MSETNLNVNINATDAGAQAAIKGLQSSVRDLSSQLQTLTTLAANSSGISAAAINKEADAIRIKLGLLQQEIALKTASSSAGVVAAQQEANYINRNMDLVAQKAQQEIRMRNSVSRAEQQAAMDSARYEAEAINRSMALREQATRQAVAQHNARVSSEREIEERNSRALADYTNRDRNLSSGQTRGSADYENRDRGLAAAKARAEAQYTNQGMDAAAAKARAEAEYANRDIDLIETKARAEAEYLNRTMQMEADKARAEAEYANRNLEMIRANERAEADYINRDMDLKARAARNAAQEEGKSNLASPRMMRHFVAVPDSLMRGQRGAALSSLGAMARDAGLGVAGLGVSMAGLAVIMGGSAIMHGAESMGKWAAESRAAASAAGMGLSAYSQLQGALVLTGMKANEADGTLRRIAINLSTAIADPASKAAEAFHVLGISQEDLANTGGNTDQVLKLLADAFVRTADGANKSAAMSEIAGRGFESIIPVLQNGSAGLAQFESEAKRLGMTLDEDTAKKLETAGQAVEHLGKTITGGGIQAFASWSPVIIATAQALEGFFGILSKVAGVIGTVASTMANIAGYIPSAAYKVGMYLAGNKEPATPGLGRSGVHAGEQIPVGAMAKTGGAETVMDQIRNQMAAARAAASGGGNRVAEDKAEINTLQQLMATEVLTDKQREQLSTELMNKTTQLNNEMATAGGKAAKQSYQDFAAAEKLKITEAQGSASKIAGIYDEWLSAAEGRYKQHASVIAGIEREKVQEINKARLDEIKEGARSTNEQNKLGELNSSLATYQSGGRGRPTRSSGPQADMADASKAVAMAQQIEASAAQEIASLQQVAQMAEAGSDTQKAAQQEIMSVLLSSKEQEVALYGKAAQASAEAAKKIAQPFIDLADNVGSTLSSGFKTLFQDLLFPQITLLKQGLTTISVSDRGTQLRSLFQKTFTSLASDFGNAMQTAIGHTVAQALSGGASNTIGELLGNLMSKAFSSITGNALGGAVGSGVGQAAGGAVGSTAVVGAIGTAATATTTGITGAIATSASAIVTAIGLGATSTTTAIATSTTAEVIATDVGHPSFLGFSGEGGGIIPSAAGGMLVGDGKGGTLNILHPKEMVLPAHISEGMQNMFKNGGNNSTSNNASLNYAPTIHTGSRGRSGTGLTRSEFGQMLSLNSGAMLGQARSMMSSGWRPA